MLKESILKQLNNNPELSSLELAKELNISEYEVLQNMPEERAKAVDASNFDEIIEDISKWGKILMIKVTPTFVIEVKDHMPTGTYGYGYYNFNSENTSIEGHLKVSEMEKIIFITKKTKTRTSYNVTFFDKDGEHMFKVFVTRDKDGEFIQEQVDAFFNLKNRF